LKRANEEAEAKRPNYRVWWGRFPYDEAANLNQALKKPKTFAVIGGTGAGKSALVELFSSKYRRIIDLYGSADNEGLTWLRSPDHKNVLLLKGASAKVDCNCADVINATDLTLPDIEAHDAVISANAFYSKDEEEWYSVGKIMQKLRNRLHWTECWSLAIREASSLIYSRLCLGDSQTMAKNYVLNVTKQMRHHGFAVALDTIRWMGIDVEMRNIADYTFIKAQGIDGLPANLRFLYRYFLPSGIMRMPVYDFVVVSRKGPVGFGLSDCPFWHKKEEEDLLRIFDIEVSYKELARVTDGKMGVKVSDYEHVRIVKARLTLKDKFERPLGMQKLAKAVMRSSATIFRHIEEHNHMVELLGQCEMCSRVNSEYAKKLIERRD